MSLSRKPVFTRAQLLIDMVLQSLKLYEAAATPKQREHSPGSENNMAR